MNQDFIYYLANHAGSLSVEEILINFLMAVVLGFVIFLSYRFSHAGAVYSAKFNASLWMLTAVTTMVMCVIGNNIALSLGMVGALSIVRFRTAIKDSRDTAYIFWCIAVGICCGISDFVIAAIGSVVIFLLMLFISNSQDNTRYLLIIRAQFCAGEKIEESMQNIYHGKERLRAKNTTKEYVEYIYELSRQILNKYMDAADITKLLLDIENVTEVNVVAQNDEITA